MKLKIKLTTFIVIINLLFSCKLEKKNEIISKPNGKAIYMDRCTSCHGMNGALGFGGAKDISKSKLSVDQIIQQVTNGKGAMAPYKNILSADEIFAVSEYAFSMRSK